MELDKELKICFISTDPSFLGGGTMYLYNLIEYLKKIESNIKNITWVYKGEKNRKYTKNQIKFVEIKADGPYPFNDIIFNIKILKFLKGNDYDIINNHLEGLWINFYKKRYKQKIVQTFHGTSYYFNKCHFGRFNLSKKLLISPLLLFNYLIARPPVKKVDDIICVAEHVKRETEKLYGKRRYIKAIRTGVDLRKFKKYGKKEAMKKLGLKTDKIYGLYVGRGGYWRKGLDRAIVISKEIYSQNKNYRLIVIGADKIKAKRFIEEKFVIYVEDGKREILPYYYNASDVFFCMSRYEGGAPTLVTSEAMASGCLVVCSKDSEQEIIKDEENGLIVEEFGEKDAEKILETLKDKKKKEKFIKDSIRTVKEISLEKWGKKYLGVLLR